MSLHTYMYIYILHWSRPSFPKYMEILLNYDIETSTWIESKHWKNVEDATLVEVLWKFLSLWVWCSYRYVCLNDIFPKNSFAMEIHTVTLSETITMYYFQLIIDSSWIKMITTFKVPSSINASWNVPYMYI
jgi:hypothetical protein